MKKIIVAMALCGLFSSTVFANDDVVNKETSKKVHKVNKNVHKVTKKVVKK